MNLFTRENIRYKIKIYSRKCDQNKKYAENAVMWWIEVQEADIENLETGISNQDDGISCLIFANLLWVFVVLVNDTFYFDHTLVSFVPLKLKNLSP